MRTLFGKALRDGLGLLAGCCAIMFAFGWIHVWVTSQISLADFQFLLGIIPDNLQGLLPVPMAQLSTLPGRISLSYTEPPIFVLASVWAIARGSDSVSGEIGRGTMEMILAQPVRRIDVILSHAAATLLGCATIATVAWSGTAIGLIVTGQNASVSPLDIVPCAVNLFGLGTFLAGVTTLVSACDRYRGRTIGIVGSFYVLQLVVELIGRTVEACRPLRWVTFFAAYQQPRLVTEPDRLVYLLGWYTLILVGLGLVCYFLAAVIFCRRDLPAPL